MFHQCFVMEQDRRFLRFLWWPAGDTSQKPRVYAMKVHLFGGKSSPSVVNYCMKKIADDNVEEFSELAIDTLRRSFYMDDMIRSVSTVEEATRLIPEMQSLLQAGGFELGKFMSTSRDVIETVEEEKRAKSLQNVNLHDSSLPQESALGLKWNVEGDFFTYSVNLDEKPLTKRGLLATTASLYDPLGLVAPVASYPQAYPTRALQARAGLGRRDSRKLLERVLQVARQNNGVVNPANQTLFPRRTKFCKRQGAARLHGCV